MPVGLILHVGAVAVLLLVLACHSCQQRGALSLLLVMLLLSVVAAVAGSSA